MNNFSKLKDLVMSLEDDFSKFYDKNNAAAGTRVRKGMQELKTMAQAFRTEVQNTKNAAAGAGAAKGAAAGGAKKASSGAAGGGAKKASGGAAGGAKGAAAGGAKKAAGKK